jgi:DNA replication protein DnaC
MKHVPTRSRCLETTHRRGMLVRFQGIGSGDRGDKKAPEAWLDLRSLVPLGTPSAWLFLIRLHACRAGLRFTRQRKFSLHSPREQETLARRGPATFSFFVKGDRPMLDRLRAALKKLRLSGLSDSLEVRLHEAQSHNLNHAEFLELLVQDEFLVRSERLFSRRVKAACFRELKTLDQFDWSFNPSIKKKQVFDLATGHFVREARDVLWLGPPGLGKSHLVQAIGYQAIKAGFLVLYRSIFDVVRDFLHDDVLGQDDKVLAKYLKPDLLIIDDMGMKQLPKRSGEYLFEIVMRRYEKRSTMMTSNRPLEDWGKLLGDVPAATAILDRFLHHADIIQITGKSYRLRNQARQGQETEEEEPKPPRGTGGKEKSKPASAEEGAQDAKPASTEGGAHRSK